MVAQNADPQFYRISPSKNSTDVHVHGCLDRESAGQALDHMAQFCTLRCDLLFGVEGEVFCRPRRDESRRWSELQNGWHRQCAFRTAFDIGFVPGRVARVHAVRSLAFAACVDHLAICCGHCMFFQTYGVIESHVMEHYPSDRDKPRIRVHSVAPDSKSRH